MFLLTPYRFALVDVSKTLLSPTQTVFGFACLHSPDRDYAAGLVTRCAALPTSKIDEVVTLRNYGNYAYECFLPIY